MGVLSIGRIVAVPYRCRKDIFFTMRLFDRPRFGSAVADLFFTESTKFLQALALYDCQIVIAGDVNVHVGINDSPDVANLQDSISGTPIVFSAVRCGRASRLVA